MQYKLGYTGHLTFQIKQKKIAFTLFEGRWSWIGVNINVIIINNEEETNIILIMSFLLFNSNIDLHTGTHFFVFKYDV